MRNSTEINLDLLGLYLTATDLAQIGGVPGLRRRLLALRAEIRTSGDATLAENFDRYARLIALRLGLPDLLEQPVRPAPTLPMRLMVSGIGRSGTTLIYQQVAKLLLLAGLKVNFRYEPYLWNIKAPATKGNAFGMSQLSPFGIHVHTATPLFLDRADPLHDSFIDHLFGEPWDGGKHGDQTAEAHLTKVIRGSGRLRSYLSRYPDLRLIVCLRNPLDTINSGLGMFSFFGEEFHENDRSRFKAELVARGVSADRLQDRRNTIEWFGAWWQAFTEETLAVAREYPDRVFSFCYEAFQADGPGMLHALQDFVGLDNEGLQLGLSHPAGPSIKATSLTSHDLRCLSGQIDFYRDAVMAPNLGPAVAGPWANRLVSRYTQGKFSFPIAGSDLGQRAPIQLRGMMLSGQQSKFQAMVQGARHPIRLSDLLVAHAGAQNIDELRTPVANADALKRGKTFGVVITCHNNQDTIVDAVLSCLQQTLPYDRILVVDDKSTDASRDRLSVLEHLYSSVTVVRLDSNLGPSAARDLGIRRLGTDFFTQLDGDDLAWPTKNASEAAVIAGDETAVAFSDILLVTADRTLILSTAAYDGAAREDVFPRLMARQSQIPRDMTLARSRYFKAGGYDLVAQLYEDWDFKLRLAAQGGRWRRATGTAGTIYNRLSPGLSGVADGLHARALSMIYLLALTRAPLPPDQILSRFDKALGRFGDSHISRSVRGVIEAALENPQTDPAQVVQQLSGRDTFAADNAALAERLGALTLTLSRVKQPA